MVDSQAAVNSVHGIKLQFSFVFDHQWTKRMPYRLLVSDSTFVQDVHDLWRPNSQGHEKKRTEMKGKRKDYTFRRQFNEGQENECLSQWGAWLVWMPSASALQQQCNVDISIHFMPKHLWDATDKVRMAFGTANTARACCPGSRLTNTESCLAARTAQHWADRQRETAYICQSWHCSDTC